MKVEEKSFPMRHFSANLNDFQQRYCRLKTADFGDFTVVMAASFFTAQSERFLEAICRGGNHSRT